MTTGMRQLLCWSASSLTIQLIPFHLYSETPPLTETASSSNLNAALGLLCFILGGTLSALIFADHWTSLNLPLPDVWYVSRPFHVPAAAILFVAGWQAHRLARTSADETAGPVFETVRMYVKDNCELCDKATDVLRQFHRFLPLVEYIDIMEDRELQDEFGQQIPVVEIDGRIRFRGIVDPDLLERLIRARQRPDAEPPPE